MSERDFPIVSRRKVLGFMGAVVLSRLVKDDFRLAPPDLTIERKTIDLRRMPADNNVGLASSGVVFENGSIAYLTQSWDIVFQHPEAKFEADTYYNYVHRSANTKGDLDAALGIGAEWLDADANETGEEILTEHGNVYDLVLIKPVVDVDEKEGRLGFGQPDTLVEMIDYLGSKSPPGRRYALNIELKRGKYKKNDPVIRVVEAIIRNRIPTTISGDKKKIKRFMAALQNYREALAA